VVEEKLCDEAEVLAIRLIHVSIHLEYCEATLFITVDFSPGGMPALALARVAV
jgi:hypothetical protein